MSANFYDLGDGRYVGINTKVASSSLATAILETHYPDAAAVLHERQGGAWPLARNRLQVHGCVPKTHTPDGPVYLLVREPVSRFLSACAFLNCEPADLIDAYFAPTQKSAISKGFVPVNPKADIHFRKQVDMLVGPQTFCYRLESHMAEFVADTGLVLPSVNVAKREKAVLSAEEREKVCEWFSDDIKLYEFVDAPGKEVSTWQPN